MCVEKKEKQEHKKKMKTLRIKQRNFLEEFEAAFYHFSMRQREGGTSGGREAENLFVQFF